jgi:6-phosphogluconolactonase
MKLHILISPLLSLAAMLTCLTLNGWAAESKPSSGTRKDTLVYFGTYTGTKSQGIYVSKLNLATGKLSAPELAAPAPNPSFVAIAPNHQFLYAVSEVGSFGGKKSGAVAAFAINGATGKLKLLNQQASGGDGPCHVSVDHTGKDVLVANYGGGSCAVLPIQPDGQLASASTFIQHRGSSANPQRQEGPHAHGAYLDPRNRFAFVPDLGLDKVMIYKFDPKQGSLIANDPPSAALAPGSGPRHMAFDAKGRFAYVINEMLCTITAFQYDTDRGSLTEIQTVSTLPTGHTLLPNYSTAEIEIHPSGKFLYGSNRGHDTLAAYAINTSTGKLTLIQHESSQGKTPRGFGIDPSGRYLIAGNQDSNNVAVYRIDLSSGRLTATGQNLEVGAPVCVRFLAP